MRLMLQMATFTVRMTKQELPPATSCLSTSMQYRTRIVREGHWAVYASGTSCWAMEMQASRYSSVRAWLLSSHVRLNYIRIIGSWCTSGLSCFLCYARGCPCTIPGPEFVPCARGISQWMPNIDRCSQNWLSSEVPILELLECGPFQIDHKLRNRSKWFPHEISRKYWVNIHFLSCSSLAHVSTTLGWHVRCPSRLKTIL